MLHTNEARDLRSALSEHFPDFRIEIKTRRLAVFGDSSNYYFMTNSHGYRMMIIRTTQNQKDLVENMPSLKTFCRNTGDICVKTDSLIALVNIIKKCEVI